MVHTAVWMPARHAARCPSGRRFALPGGMAAVTAGLDINGTANG